MAKKKTMVEKLGLEPVEKYNRTNLRKRIKTLEKNLKAGSYRGQKEKTASRYLSWFKSKLKQIEAA